MLKRIQSSTHRDETYFDVNTHIQFQILIFKKIEVLYIVEKFLHRLYVNEYKLDKNYSDERHWGIFEQTFNRI